MRYHSNRKVRTGKRLFINVLYGLGVNINKIVSLTGVSRATVYRHISK